MRVYLHCRALATDLLQRGQWVGLWISLIGILIDSDQLLKIGAVVMAVKKTTTEPDIKIGDLISADDVCELIGVCRTTLWRLHAAGKAPPHIDFGKGFRRYHMPSVQKWLKARIAETGGHLAAGLPR